jgi:hypothetical protein
MQIVRYEDRHVEAVKRLNARFAAAGETWGLPLRPLSEWLPGTRGEDAFEHHYVAEDGDEVRGGYILKWQPFWIEGQMRQVSALYLPLSEGIIHPGYRSLGLTLIHDALERSPLTFCLGMGGSSRRLPQVLRMLDWQVHDLPFFFLPVRAGRFLDNLQPLKGSLWKRGAAWVASATGLAAAALAAVKTLRRPSREVRLTTTTEVVESFGPWADDVWDDAKSRYSLCADRRGQYQNLIYPHEVGESIRVLVKCGGKVVGWFVGRSRLMRGHKYFGDMRVGSLIDALARPGFETHVAWAARQFLTGRGSDIIVCNIQHQDWGAALGCAGLFKGPSNFALATSPALGALLDPYNDRITCAHFMRGDGEGPTNL